MEVRNMKLYRVVEWKQTRIMHCPRRECKGMLLSSDHCHELKCGDCENYFIEITELIETTKPKEIKKVEQ